MANKDKRMLKLISKRKAAGLTQTQLAEKVGAKQSAIASYENGDRRPSIDRLKEISIVLNCTLDDLF